MTNTNTPLTSEPTEERIGLRLNADDVAAMHELSQLTAIRIKTELFRFALHFTLNNYPRPPAKRCD